MTPLRKAIAVVPGLLFAMALHGQPPPRKWLLSIGNSSYQALPAIATAAQDAKLVGTAFESIGFTVLRKESLDHISLKSAIEDQFVSKLQAGDTAAFYFSGYGIQVDGDNYLLPSGYDPASKDDIDGRAYSVTRLLGLLKRKKISLSLVILDACRALPSPDPHATGAGLALMSSGPGSVFALSNLSDSTVPNDANRAVANAMGGYYAQAISRALQTPGLTPGQAFQLISDKVRDDTKGAQVPLAVANLQAEIYLLPALPAVQPALVSEVRPVAIPNIVTPEKPRLATTAGRGFYYLNPSGSAEILELVRQKSHITIKMMGFAGATEAYELDGPRARVRLKSGQAHEFLVNRSEAGTSLPDGEFGMLYALSAKSKGRELKMATAGPAGLSTSVAESFPVTIAAYGPGVLKIAPATPLPPGEYAFLAPDNWGATQGGNKVRELFCFGVDPK